MHRRMLIAIAMIRPPTEVMVMTPLVTKPDTTAGRTRPCGWRATGSGGWTRTGGPARTGRPAWSNPRSISGA